MKIENHLMSLAVLAIMLVAMPQKATAQGDSPAAMAAQQAPGNYPFAAITPGTPQSAQAIPLLSGEKWWGAYTSAGAQLPIGDKPFTRGSLTRDCYANQAAPLLVSNMGRYIWSPRAFDFTFDGRQFSISNATAPVTVGNSGRTLREAYVIAAGKHFKPAAKQIPPDLFFTAPQYNTWIEMGRQQNQQAIETYADGILAAGLPAGVLMIDNGWQRYHGSLDFKSEAFSDPRGMVEGLHARGFKVMLWVSPFVSADSPEFAQLSSKGYLVKGRNSEAPAIVWWWDGASAVYDLTNPAAFDYLKSELERVQREYGIDGFKFDAGDVHFYNPQAQSFYNPAATPTDQSWLWAELGRSFGYNEYRACWGHQGEPLVQRLNDKQNNWNALRLTIPEMLNAGLTGYAYTCADMIGGGEFSSFAQARENGIDQDLVVRWAQASALMPMMQFSVAPWRVLDAEHAAYCVEAAKLHAQFAPYILELAREAATSGEPIVRHLEYNFPNKGFADCDDQFMLGTRYMVAPVMSPDGRREVRLPAGTWVDDQGQRFKGPLVIKVNAPLGRLLYYEYKR